MSDKKDSEKNTTKPTKFDPRKEKKAKTAAEQKPATKPAGE